MRCESIRLRDLFVLALSGLNQGFDSRRERHPAPSSVDLSQLLADFPKLLGHVGQVGFYRIKCRHDLPHAIVDYVSAGAASLANQLVDECFSAATAAGHPLDDGEVAKIRAYVTQAGSTITTSMLRDIENDSPIEADQIIGDMMRRASSFSLPAPILSTVHAYLKSYELHRSQRIAARDRR